MYKNRINYKLLNFLILMGLLYIIVTNIGTWFNIFLSIISICMPFIIAFAIAYALNPIVRKLVSKGVRKSLAVTIVVVAVTAIIITLLVITLPLLYNQLVMFATNFGKVIEDVGDKFNINLSFIADSSEGYLNDIINSLGNFLKDGSIDIVGKTASFLGKLVICYVVSIYFLAYMDNIRRAIGDFLKQVKYKYFRYVKALDTELSNYLKGLLTFMVIQFFEYSIVFLIVGHPNWFLFGVLASLTTVIPYFGGLITNLLALLTASVISPTLFIATLVICLIFPQLDGYVISPRVYGKTNNVNPLITIMMVSIGGTVGGPLGIIIALPVYILISASYRFFKNDIKKGVKKVKAEIS